MHPINGHDQTTEQQNNSQLPCILHHQSQRNESKGSKKLSELSSTMLALWTALCYQPSTHYQINNQVQLKNTEAAITHFLDYAATNPSAIIQYKSSDMILHIDSDASYLSESRAHRRTGGHYYLSSLPTDPKKSPNLLPPENGPIHTECRILKHVVASRVESEVGGMFHNGQTAVPLIITLYELCFNQPTTPIKTDNSAAKGIVTATVRQKRSKATDIQFYWMKDRLKQKTF